MGFYSEISKKPLKGFKQSDTRLTYICFQKICSLIHLIHIPTLPLCWTLWGSHYAAAFAKKVSHESQTPGMLLLEKSFKRFCGLGNADTLVPFLEIYTARSQNEGSDKSCSKEIHITLFTTAFPKSI